jgi:hypothetical protein
MLRRRPEEDDMHNGCEACQMGRAYNLKEWETNLLHDVAAHGVTGELLRRVAALAAQGQVA